MAGWGPSGLGRPERPCLCSLEVFRLGVEAGAGLQDPRRQDRLPSTPWPGPGYVLEWVCGRTWCDRLCQGGGPRPAVSGVGRTQRLLKAEHFPKERDAGVEYGAGGLFKPPGLRGEEPQMVPPPSTPPLGAPVSTNHPQPGEGIPVPF